MLPSVMSRRPLPPSTKPCSGRRTQGYLSFCRPLREDVLARAETAQLPRAQHCFKDDTHGHFRGADATFSEYNRRFDQVKAGMIGPVFKFNLKSIPFALYSLEVYGFEHPTMPDVIATGGILDWQSEQPACIEGTGLTDALPSDTPMACPPTVSIASAHDCIMVFKLLEQAWQVSGVVGEVSIHLHDDLIVSGQGPLKASNISRTESKLAGAGEEIHLVPMLVLHQSDLFLCTIRT